jgi:hypothetical protein
MTEIKNTFFNEINMGSVHTGKNDKNLTSTNKFLQKFVTYFENA